MSDTQIEIDIKITQYCILHPDYQAVRPPTSGCVSCTMIYNAAKGMEQSGEMVAEDIFKLLSKYATIGAARA